MTEKGDGGGGVRRGLASRRSWKEKATVPVPPLRPPNSRLAAATAAGAGAAGDARLGPRRAARERRGRGAGSRGPCRPLSSPSTPPPPPPPPAGLGPDAARAADPGGAPNVSRVRAGWERVRSGWAPGGRGARGRARGVGRGPPAGCLSGVGPQEFACDRRSLSPACRWPRPDAEAKARSSLCLFPLPPPRSSFPSSPIFGDGAPED